MCCSLERAVFTGTRIYIAEVLFEGKEVHTLGYQNDVRSIPRNGKNAANAMLLHLPAVPGSMSEKNLLDTSQNKSFLKDIERALDPPPVKSRGMGKLSFGASKSYEPIVFEHDVYTVVLSEKAGAIPDALYRVPAVKRPNINREIFDWYAQEFPDWTFALCCFNNRDRQTASPLLWYYEPKDPAVLHAPGLDAHDGSPPDLKGDKMLDHTIAIGSYRAPNEGIRVNYSEELPGSLKPFLLPNIVGQKYTGPAMNGDFGYDIHWARTNKIDRVVGSPEYSYLLGKG